MLSPTDKRTRAEGLCLTSCLIKRLLLLTFSLVAVCLLARDADAQQATLTDDAHTSASKSNKNFGLDESVQITGTTERGFFKFKLTPSLPAGTTGTRVGKATLKLFVASVDAPGALSVHRVTGAWTEGAIREMAAPSLGAQEATLAVDAAQAGKWLTIDITQLVKDWLDGVLPNEGIAVVAAQGGANILIDSKESLATSHEARLEITLNHATTADRAATADHAAQADHAATADTATVANVVAPLTLTSADPSFTLSVVNNGTGAAISSTGHINTTTQYNIGGQRVLSTTGANNTFVGAFAGFSNTTGVTNTFVGRNAGFSNTTGGLNTFVGVGAGGQNTEGSSNSFFGVNAGFRNTTGINNSIFGLNAGFSNTTGNNNSFFGAAAGTFNTTGISNAFYGSNAGRSNTTGSGNVFMGAGAGLNNLTGSLNTAYGSNAGVFNTEGDNNVFVGVQAGRNNTTGDNNVFLGSFSGQSNTTENLNTFVGAGANGAPGIINATALGAGATVTQSNTVVLGTPSANVQIPGNLNVSGTISGTLAANINATVGGTFSADAFNAVTQYSIAGKRVLSVVGTQNTVVGVNAGLSLTTEFNNAFFGMNAGRNNVGGNNNSFFGTFAGMANTNGTGNAFFGTSAGRSNTIGSNNSFFGSRAGDANTTGSQNSFFGTSAGDANTTGADNSFFGRASGELNTTGSSNSFFGTNSGSFNLTGGSNSFFGNFSGFSNSSGMGNVFVGSFVGRNNTSGSSNLFLGLNAGSSNTVENNNTFVGAGANGVAGIDNATAVGAGALVAQSNSVVLGQTSASVGIGTPAPKQKLQVEGGNVYVGTPGQGFILKSPDGATCRLLTIDNAGALVLSPLACP
jgi:hypothetical protein